MSERRVIGLMFLLAMATITLLAAGMFFAMPESNLLLEMAGGCALTVTSLGTFFIGYTTFKDWNKP